MQANVLEELAQLRVSAQMTADKNLHKAKQNAKFNSLYTEIKEMEMRGDVGEDYEKKVLSLNAVLKEMAMTMDDLLPKYSCDKCKDTGFVGDSMCQCLKRRRADSILSTLGASLNRNHTFGNSDYAIFDDPSKMKSIYNKIEEWCDDIENSKFKNLLLCGMTGTGKTYLSECILNKLIDKGTDVRFYSAFALSQLLLKFHTTFSSEEGKYDMLDEVLHVPVLVIDDLGSEPKYRNVTEEYMYVLLGERLKLGLTTICSTNLELDVLALHYGDRVFSRLCYKPSTLIVKMENSDLRLKR